MTSVLIKRELLERLPLNILMEHGYNQTAAQISAALAAPANTCDAKNGKCPGDGVSECKNCPTLTAPRQPEGGGAGGGGVGMGVLGRPCDSGQSAGRSASR